MTEKDVAGVLAIEAASFGASRLPAAEPAPHAGRLDAAQLREELARPWARIWIARAEGAEISVAAFLLAWHVADELHVLDVATHPTLRRRGYGRALLQHALAYARAHAIRHVLLEVRRSNAPAIGLYRECGFFAMGVRKGYYADGEDAVEMLLAFDERGEVERRKDEVGV